MKVIEKDSFKGYFPSYKTTPTIATISKHCVLAQAITCSGDILNLWKARRDVSEKFWITILEDRSVKKYELITI